MYIHITCFMPGYNVIEANAYTLSFLYFNDIKKIINKEVSTQFTHSMQQNNRLHKTYL